MQAVPMHALRFAQAWRHRRSWLIKRTPVRAAYHLQAAGPAAPSIEDWARRGGGLLDPEVVPGGRRHQRRPPPF